MFFWGGQYGAAAGAHDPHSTLMASSDCNSDDFFDPFADRTPGDELVRWFGVPAPGGAIPAVDYSAQTTLEAIYEAVRRFFREARIPYGTLSGRWDYLRDFVHRRLNYSMF